MPIVIDYNPVRQLVNSASGAGIATGMADRQQAGMQQLSQILAYNQHQQDQQAQQDQAEQDRQARDQQLQNHLLQQNYENQFQQYQSGVNQGDKQQQLGIEAQHYQGQQANDVQKRQDAEQQQVQASAALDQAHASGQISDEDYQRAKVNLLSGDRSPFGSAGRTGDGISGDGLGQARLDLHTTNQAINTAKYRVQLAAQTLRQMQNNNRFKYAPEGSPEKAQFAQAQQDYVNAKAQFDQVSAPAPQMQGAGQVAPVQAPIPQPMPQPMMQQQAAPAPVAQAAPMASPAAVAPPGFYERVDAIVAQAHQQARGNPALGRQYAEQALRAAGIDPNNLPQRPPPTAQVAPVDDRPGDFYNSIPMTG